MKNRKDLINEYGLILRWNNGGCNDDINHYSYSYYLEGRNGNRIIIKDKKALDFISKKRTTGFRNSEMYKNHIELFKILGMEK